MFNIPHLFLDEGSAGGSGSSGQPGQQTDEWKSKYDTLLSKYNTDIEALNKAHTSEKTDWDKRFGGLQTTFNKERDAHEALKTQFNSATAEQARLATDLGTTKATLEQKLTAFSKLETDSKLTQTALQRAKYIMANHPELASFEAKGLLPAADTEEALGKVLSSFKDALGSIEEDARKRFGKGGSPDPTKSGDGNGQGQEGGPVDLKSMLKKATDLAHAGNTAEYDVVMNEYYAALAKADAK